MIALYVALIVFPSVVETETAFPPVGGFPVFVKTEEAEDEIKRTAK